MMRIVGISGWTREPPADNYLSVSKHEDIPTSGKHTEYAVEPVGVETVRPSAWTVVRWWSSATHIC